jgi:Holliday junction DNA helicase RuvA
MIAFVRGNVALSSTDHIIVDVGGVGVLVNTTLSAAAAAVEGEPIYLHTVLVVREDAWALYGFLAHAERDLFNLLTSVSGIGPRLGLSILSHMSLDRLRQAVLNKQPELLTRVPGIGKKTAEKIVFELRDKLRGVAEAAPSGDAADVNADVIEALITFGYSQSEAQAAIKSIPAETPNDFEERMRVALAYFMR